MNILQRIISGVNKDKAPNLKEVEAAAVKAETIRCAKEYLMEIDGAIHALSGFERALNSPDFEFNPAIHVRATTAEYLLFGEGMHLELIFSEGQAMPIKARIKSSNE